MMEYETEQRLYQYHTGNALAIIANSIVALGGKELRYPEYTELLNRYHGKTTKDTRTADEIKRDLLKKLTG